MSADCPPDCCAAYVAGELPANEVAAFEAHAAVCEECRARVTATRRVISRLKELPVREISPDLAPAILARVREDRSPSAWMKPVAIAAAVTLLAGLSAWHFASQPGTPLEPARTTPNLQAASRARAIDWLCQQQEADGSWDASRWGGQARFQVALTALPLLAIASADGEAQTRADAVGRAAAWLRGQQRADGSFGPEFSGAPYNTSIATLALLRASAHAPHAELREAIETALAALLARQMPDGGWGYAHTTRADRSITEWHAEALEAASAHGWEAARPPLERARTWLSAHPASATADDEPLDSASESLPSAPLAGAPALDFYHAYFLTTHSHEHTDAATRRRVAELRQTLLVRQVHGGAEAGTWPPDDRWGRAGGRLYSTALAALSLGPH